METKKNILNDRLSRNQKLGKTKTCSSSKEHLTQCCIKTFTQTGVKLLRSKLLNKPQCVLRLHFVSDEDFACVKAPPSKKPKDDVGQEQRRSSSKSFSQEKNSQSTRSEKSRWVMSRIQTNRY